MGCDAGGGEEKGLAGTLHIKVPAVIETQSVLWTERVTMTSASDDDNESLQTDSDEDAVYQMRPVPITAHRMTRKELRSHSRWRCHVFATFFLALLVLLLATAVTFESFDSGWGETLAVAKVMAPVGLGDRCQDPCRFFAKKYPSPTDVLLFLRSPPNDVRGSAMIGGACPRLDTTTKHIALLQSAAVGAEGVDVVFTCTTNMPFSIIGANTSLPPTVNVHPYLFAGVFHRLRIEPLYLAYVGLPMLLAKGYTVDAALAAVLKAAASSRSSVRFPHVSSLELVEAAAVQTLCTAKEDDRLIAKGIGCNAPGDPIAFGPV